MLRALCLAAAAAAVIGDVSTAAAPAQFVDPSAALVQRARRAAATFQQRPEYEGVVIPVAAAATADAASGDAAAAQSAGSRRRLFDAVSAQPNKAATLHATGYTQLYDHVVSVDNLPGVQAMNCDGDSMLVLLAGDDEAAWAARGAVLVGGPQWQCETDASGRPAPFYRRVTGDASARMVTLGSGSRMLALLVPTATVTVASVFQDLDLRITQLATTAARPAPAPAQEAAADASGARRLGAAEYGGYVPFGWAGGNGDSSRVAWNLLPTIQSTFPAAAGASGAAATIPAVNVSRIPLTSPLWSSQMTCTDCYLQASIDFSVSLSLSNAALRTAKIAATMHATGRFAVEAITANTTQGANSGISSTTAVMPATVYQTLSFSIAGVPLVMPLALSISVQTELTYAGPTRGVITGAGMTLSGSATVGAVYDADSAGWSSVQRGSWDAEATTPAFSLSGPAVLNIMPAVMIDTQLFADWNVSVLAAPYLRMSVDAGAGNARLVQRCARSLAPAVTSRIDDRVHVEAYTGMLGMVTLLNAPDRAFGPWCAAWGCTAATRQGLRLATPADELPKTVGPYSLTTEAYVSALGASSCVQNYAAVPGIQNWTSVCRTPNACAWESGRWDDVCSADCVGGTVSREVRCAYYEAGVFNGVYASAEGCAVSPTAGARPATTQACPQTFIPCGVLRVWPGNPICNTSQSTEQITLSVSRRCTFVSKLDAYLGVACNVAGTTIAGYVCPTSDCDPFTGGVGCQAISVPTSSTGTCGPAPAILGSNNGLVASCGGALTAPWSEIFPLEQGRVVNIDLAGAPVIPEWRFFSVLTGGSEVVNVVIQYTTGVKPVPEDNLEAIISSQPRCTNAALTGPGTCSVFTSADDYAVGTGAVRSMTVTPASVIQDGSSTLFLSVRCYGQCNIAAYPLARGQPLSPLIAVLKVTTNINAHVLLRPDASAVGFGVLSIGAASAPAVHTVLARPFTGKSVRAWPRLSEAGTKGETLQSTPVSFNFSTFFPFLAPYSTAFGSGSLIVTGASYTPGAEYGLTVAARADFLMSVVVQAFELYSLVPGKELARSQVGGTLTGFLLDVPTAVNAVQLRLGLTRGSGKLCVGPGAGAVDMRQCTAVTNSRATLLLQASAVSWWSRTFTILVQSQSDMSFTVSAVAVELLDHGDSVQTEAVSGLMTLLQGPADKATPDEQTGLRYFAHVHTLPQSAAAVSMFAAPGNAYAPAPAEGFATHTVLNLPPGKGQTIEGEYAPAIGGQPLMMAVRSEVVDAPLFPPTVMGGRRAETTAAEAEAAAEAPAAALRGNAKASEPLLPAASATSHIADISAAGSAARKLMYVGPALSSYSPAALPRVFLYDAMWSVWREQPASRAACVDYPPSTAPGAFNYEDRVCASIDARAFFSSAAVGGETDALVVLPASSTARIALELSDAGLVVDPNATYTPGQVILQACVVQDGTDACTPVYSQRPLLTAGHCGASPRGMRLVVSANNVKDLLLQATALNITVAFNARSSPCATKYAWRVGTWSGCSSACSNGTQTREAVCMDQTGATVADSSLCPQPAPQVLRLCYNGPCVVTPGPWGECTKPCGSGMQYRTAACVNLNGTGSIVPNAQCLVGNASDAVGLVAFDPSMVHLSQACNTGACPATYWSAAPWSACSAPCGGGSQSRTVICTDGTKAVSDVLCGGGSRPAGVQACNTAPCAVAQFQLQYADMRTILVGGNSTDTIMAGETRYYRIPRASAANGPVCISATSAPGAPFLGCTASRQRELASCAASLRMCLALNSRTRTVNGTIPVVLPGTPDYANMAATGADVCSCYMAAHMCVAEASCNPHGRTLADTLAMECKASTCPLDVPGTTACNVRNDVPARGINDTARLSIMASVVRGTTPPSALPVTAADADYATGAVLLPGRQALSIAGPAQGFSDGSVSSLIVGVSAVGGGANVTVLVTHITARLQAIATGSFAAQAGKAVNGSRINGSPYSAVLSAADVRTGGLTLNLSLAAGCEMFVDPNADLSARAAIQGVTDPSAVAVDTNALFAGITANTRTAGGWEEAAKPYLLQPAGSAPGGSKVVTVANWSTTMTITLPPIPTYNPMADEVLTLTIPGMFLLSGRPLAVPEFVVKVTATAAVRDCVVGPWSAWSACPGTCGASARTRTRAILSPAAGTGAPCPATTESAPCDPCNPCAYVTCVNGGLCVEGTCVCPDGYGGPSCSIPPANPLICTARSLSTWSSCWSTNITRRQRSFQCGCTDGSFNASYTNREPVDPPPTVAPSATPSPSASSTASLSSSPSSSNTPTPSASSNTSATPSASVSGSATPTVTTTATLTGTPTPSSTTTASMSATPSPSFNFSAAPRATNSPNATWTPPVSCGTISVPPFATSCPAGLTAAGAAAALTQYATAAAVITVPLVGVNTTAMRLSLSVQDAWMAVFARQLAAAAGVPADTIYPLGVGACGGTSTARDCASLEITVDPSQLTGAGTAQVQLVTPDVVVYRIAALLGFTIGADRTATGTTMRALAASQPSSATAMLAAITTLGARGSDVRVSMYSAAGAVTRSSALTAVPGVAGGAASSISGPTAIVQQDVALTGAVAAFAGLFVIACIVAVVLVRRKHKSGKAPRPRRRSSFKDQPGTAVSNPMLRAGSAMELVGVQDYATRGAASPAKPVTSLPPLAVPLPAVTVSGASTAPAFLRGSHGSVASIPGLFGGSTGSSSILSSAPPTAVSSGNNGANTIKMAYPPSGMATAVAMAAAPPRVPSAPAPAPAPAPVPVPAPAAVVAPVVVSTNPFAAVVAAAAAAPQEQAQVQLPPPAAVAAPAAVEPVLVAPAAVPVVQVPPPVMVAAPVEAAVQPVAAPVAMLPPPAYPPPPMAAPAVVAEPVPVPPATAAAAVVPPGLLPPPPAPAAAPGNPF